MGRGEAPWPGVAARRFRCSPGLLALAFTLTLPTAGATGCAGSSPGEPSSGTTRTTASASTSASPAASASASAQPTLSGAELCTNAVRYWAREMLAGGTPYGDYQSMGLSNRQYDILREVVDAARATKRAQGQRAADELIDRRASEDCADHYRDGGPTDGPWR
ncbi:conserved exported protein of unknown function [Streptomyces ambofaciens ATCC 23877]|uniref:Uncharacterized protein n=1 Tax=Streptomyces ambofaciens (strain ATCC 23877 / 3486 / DSM 40053 / JCM 4204 / NBRC 12836 / NRRL B-2516) TaxID=278992 RepID=A0A0K2AQ84_STRA7|nr:hypothetical protein [Streptomyces ambofaciens]AKZ55139.1 conserved exported protein of unknown function [Streptomyces ambofaciens ATCC 23877]